MVPDSVRVPRKEALGWLYDEPDDQDAVYLRTRFLGETERLEIWQRHCAQHKAKVCTSLALTVQHPVGVFYERQGFGLRGFRYGILCQEYTTGFGGD